MSIRKKGKNYEIDYYCKGKRYRERKDGLPRANSTCNREVEAIRRLLNKANEWGMLERNPASRLKSLPEPRGRTRFLSLDEAKRLLEESSRHLRPIIVCALETGMRRGEILNLRCSDVDIKTHTIYLGKTKNGESRHLPISNRLFPVLSNLPRRLGNDHVFTGEKWSKACRIGRPEKQIVTKWSQNEKGLRTGNP